MKKRGWILLLAVIACIVLIGIKVEKQRRRDREDREFIVGILYEIQNWAIPRRGGDLNVPEYSPYENVNENELYIRLTKYNQAHPGEVGLKLEDIKEYLEKEHNEDGSLRVETGYEKIHDYIEWYGHGGAEKVEDYWDKLDETYVEFSKINPQIASTGVKRLTQSQLEELIKKEADPAYEMNNEIMEGGK